MEQLPPVPEASTPQAQDNILTEDVIRELKALEAKTGVRFSKIEEDYKRNFNGYDIKMPLPMRRSYALMQVRAETSNLGDNPLVDYEMFVLGAVETKKSIRAICYTMMVRPNGGGDPKDMFNPVEGKLGIPTVASFFDGAGKVDIAKLLPETWWSANLTVTGTGVARRDVSATSYTNFVPINKPISDEQINLWKDKTFPLMTLADVKSRPSRLIQGRKEGSKPFQDGLDLRRVVGAVKQTGMRSREDGSEFCTYTIVDNSLSETDLLNIKDAEGKIIKYGGVQVYVPKNQYVALNLAEESLIEIIGTARVEDGQLSMNAVCVKVIVRKERKTPVSQRPSGQPAAQGVKSTSLADMANKPATYI